jgi:hypothetical protein
MEFIDYYKVLEVDKKATEEEIKKAGRDSRNIYNSFRTMKGFGPFCEDKDVRDGKITFEEVINLAKNISLPFSSSNTNFDDLVKIGYIDLDDRVSQTNDSFDVSLKQDTTLKINNLFAQNTNRIEDIDFLIATRVSLKKVSRQIISRNDVQSTYKSGERQEQNPNYATALVRYAYSEKKRNKKKLRSV